MAVGDAHVFPGFLTPVLTQLSFPKPPTTFLTCFCRGVMRKYAGKKVRLIRGSNSQPPGHESDTLTTEPPGRETRFGDSIKASIGASTEARIEADIGASIRAGIEASDPDGIRSGIGDGVVASIEAGNVANIRPMLRHNYFL